MNGNDCPCAKMFRLVSVPVESKKPSHLDLQKMFVLWQELDNGFYVMRKQFFAYCETVVSGDPKICFHFGISQEQYQDYQIRCAKNIQQFSESDNRSCLREELVCSINSIVEDQWNDFSDAVAFSLDEIERSEPEENPILQALQPTDELNCILRKYVNIESVPLVFEEKINISYLKKFFLNTSSSVLGWKQCATSDKQPDTNASLHKSFLPTDSGATGAIKCLLASQIEEEKKETLTSSSTSLRLLNTFTVPLQTGTECTDSSSSFLKSKEEFDTLRMPVGYCLLGGDTFLAIYSSGDALVLSSTKSFLNKVLLQPGFLPTVDTDATYVHRTMFYTSPHPHPLVTIGEEDGLLELMDWIRDPARLLKSACLDEDVLVPFRLLVVGKSEENHDPSYIHNIAYDHLLLRYKLLCQHIRKRSKISKEIREQLISWYIFRNTNLVLSLGSLKNNHEQPFLLKKKKI